MAAEPTPRRHRAAQPAGIRLLAVDDRYVCFLINSGVGRVIPIALVRTVDFLPAPPGRDDGSGRVLCCYAGFGPAGLPCPDGYRLRIVDTVTHMFAADRYVSVRTVTDPAGVVRFAAMAGVDQNNN